MPWASCLQAENFQLVLLSSQNVFVNWRCSFLFLLLNILLDIHQPPPPSE
jgi:hypothetical protein